MALYKRGKIWWIDITHEGKRIQRTSGTSNKINAHKLHDKLKAQLWTTKMFQEKSEHDWNDAVIRWCEESQHKKSLHCDKSNFRWLNTYLYNTPLKMITRDMIENIAQCKENEDASPATVNRILALIRAILRKAEREWEWLERAPNIRMRKEDNKRIRWLTLEETLRLKNELPTHLADAMEFAIHTGLRESNITRLEWSEVDFERCHAFIPASKSKSGKAIAVPLNSKVIDP